MIVHSRNPYNAEPELARLRHSAVTPRPDFYVRCHGDIPALTEETHRLRIGGLVRRPLDLSLADLRAQFAPRSVTAVMQCAGNRRADLHAVRPVAGDPWAGGAIGNATWTGAALAEVLRAAGVDPGPSLHVAFAAADTLAADPPFTYGASIPLAKALAPETLLAFEMNHEPLAPEHGFPLRVVVPGFAGARSPKWLTAITVQDRPSDNPMQQREYKLVPPDAMPDTVDWAAGVTINEMPLTSAICEPAPGATLQAGPAVIKGYAAASARAVARVDVSRDSGRTWVQARLEHDAAAPWSWTLWTATLDLPRGDHELAVRAWDSAGQTQPARAGDVWNFKGYLSAAWHRVRVSAG